MNRAASCLPQQPVGGTTPGRPRAVNRTLSYRLPLFGMMLASVIIKHFLDEI